MVQYTPDQLDAVFNALANPTRRAIVVRLAAGDASVSELAEPFGVSLPGMAKHLRVLEHAGLVDQHKHGRVRRCRLRAAPMRFAEEWLSSYRVFWENRLESLAMHFESHHEEER
jgi:DNA-binding transcriptional ArsR family regulator